jgi:hypothetical protein
MLYRVCGEEEKIQYGANVVVVIQPADLVALANGNTGTLNIVPPNPSVIAYPEGGTNPTIPLTPNAQLPIGSRVKLEAMVVLPAGTNAAGIAGGPFTFSDAGIVSMTISAGDALQSGGANTTRYLAATEVSAPATYVPYSIGSGTQFVLLAADQLTLTLTGTAGHNLNTCTGGEVALYFRVDDLTALPQS